MEFSPLLYLMNIGFTMIDIGLFHSGENLEMKICRFQTFLDNGHVNRLGLRRLTVCQISLNALLLAPENYLLATCFRFFLNLFLYTAFVISILFYLNIRHFSYEIILFKVFFLFKFLLQAR